MKREMWMEDAESISVEVDRVIENRLKDFNIHLTDFQADSIHDRTWEVLEDVSNGNYRNYN